MNDRALTQRQLLADERGTLHKQAETRIALCYPSPYNAAMASLGYQQIYRVLHDMPGVAADRAMLGDDRTLDGDRPLGSYPLLAFSVAYELEIAGLIEQLERANVPVLAADREPHHPLVIAGGPLTFSNPAPLAPFCDAILLGEGEDLIIEFVELARDVGFSRERVWAALKDRPGYYLPHVHGETVPKVAQASDRHLPARSPIITPHSALSNMFMTEAARGCSRGCTYCVMRRSTNGGMRVVPMADILAGGYRTLTVAADGASERMRRVVERSTRADHLIASAKLAATHRMAALKVYMMVGVPSETDADIDELVELSKELAAAHGRIAYGIAPFVAKRNTPLDGTAFAGIDVVDHRLARLRAGLAAAKLGRRVEIRPTSARWAWVEYMIAQGESSAGLAILVTLAVTVLWGVSSNYARVRLA
ncbi:MAG: radical SAM protein, partial [Proteobacteria bacterium]|nr:radical SAM protein [Pseudomonadota bacterium]